MTPTDWLDGASVRFVLHVNDVAFVEEWMRTSVDGRTSEHVWITHLDRVGGGEAVTAAARVHQAVASTMRYQLYSDRLPLADAVIRDTECVLTLTDQSTQTLRLPAPPSFVFQSNVIGQLARFIATQDPLGGDRAVTFFSPEALTTRTLELSPSTMPNGDIEWRTSLGAVIVCDSAGGMRSMTSESAQFNVTVEPAAFPSTDLDALRRPKLRYEPPCDLAVTVEDLTVVSRQGPLTVCISRPASGMVSHRAVFIHGSGRHDRHGMTAGLDLRSHELCDLLSASGIEVVRYDSRGTGSTTFGDLLDGDLRALVDDAEAAARVLDGHGESVFLIGHSLGALVAMMIALEDRIAVRGLVLLAPAGRPFDQVLADQGDRESHRLGMTDEQVLRRRDLLESAFEAVRAEGEEVNSMEAQLFLGGMSVTLLRELLEVDPADLLPRVTQPVLICYGSKDIQVSIVEDGLRLLHACDGNGTDAILILLPDVDHLLMVEPDQSVPERYFTPRPISRAVINACVAWMDRSY